MVLSRIDNENITINAKNTGKQKKRVWEFVCYGIVALIFFCYLIYLSIGGVTAYTPDRINSDESDDIEVRFNIESMEILENHLSIVGWAFVPYEDIQRYQTHILLRSRHGGEYIMLPTVMRWRADITEYFYNSEMETNFNYDMSGWHARVNIGMLNQPLEQYEIVILYRNNGRYILVETNTGV